MSAFTFPQPGEHTNAASISIPERTLAALYALALVGRDHLTVRGETFVTPQCRDALDVVGVGLSVEMYKAATANAAQMQLDMSDEYLF